ncbi:serine acetyltransferase [Hyalangium gracile]|uniref:serine acetyltransferase n=1 Tax=Hyalangium gracile TaxID=394092 RepID=UPI001CC9E737|nr:serine acetyltransferase [Hyalangium gracile]
MNALSLWSLSRRLAGYRMPLASRLVRKLGLVLYSAYLPAEAEIGEHTTLGYGGIGVFIHPKARIGHHCILSQFISIGGMRGLEGAPTIGDYVRIGTGARILGPVRIGDFAVVGANSVVMRDVPAGTVVFGIPARVVRTPADPVAEYERETGRQVSPVDRERAPRPRSQHRPPSRMPLPGRNEVSPGEQPDLFELDPQVLAPDAPPPASASDPATELWVAAELPSQESHSR